MQPERRVFDDSVFLEMYKTMVEPCLAAAARQRRRDRIAMWPVAAGVFAVSIVLAATVPVVFREADGSGDRNWFSILLFAAAVTAVAHWWIGSWLMRRGEEAARRAVFGPLAARLGHGLGYDAKRSLKAGDMAESGLFDPAGSRHDKHRLRGMFYGRHSEKDFVFAPVVVDRAVPHGCHIRRGLLFSGFFGRVEGVEEADGAIVSFPRVAAMTSDLVAARLDAMGIGGTVIAAGTGDADSDRLYDTFVIADDGDNEAERKRQGRLLRELTPLWRDAPHGLSLSRVGGRWFFAMTTSQTRAGMSILEYSGKPAAFRGCIDALERCRETVAMIVDSVQPR